MRYFLLNGTIKPPAHGNKFDETEDCDDDNDDEKI